MRIFVAGATGAVSMRLVPLLVEHGHEVVGMTRTPEKADRLRAMGARPSIADGLDPGAVTKAVAGAEPEVVVHQMTALTALSDLRRFDREFAPTNRLRTEGTDHLLAAARAAGCSRFVAQSFAGWPYAREGGPVKDEDDRLDPEPPKQFASTLAAIRYMEQAVVGAWGMEGIILRYGTFYGPGTSISQGGDHLEAVRRRRFPIVGNGRGVWSLVHIDDVAWGTLAAIERGKRGIYNIVDDEPAAIAEWLPALAAAIGARPPRRLPAWVGRLAVGGHAVAIMTEIRGASNHKAKQELGWQPRYASWRQGFKTLVATEDAKARQKRGGPDA
ncbi:NAD(P)-dependent oxidoreductase [soil metagenome]